MNRRKERVIPRSVNEAVDILIKELPRYMLFMLKGMDKHHLAELHLGSQQTGMPRLGISIRNNFDLWKHNQELKEDCSSEHPDEVSIIIIDALHSKVKEITL